MSALAPPLTAALEEIAEAAADFTDQWWIIGSAAAALAGADVGAIGDVDLLLSSADGAALAARWTDRRLPDPPASAQFRSGFFARFRSPGLPIEAMGDFEIEIAGHWRRVAPATRVPAGRVFIPSVGEQMTIFAAMDRLKDAARVAALRKLQRA